VEELRSKREESLEDKGEGANPTEGDAIFENASLFLQDALVSREMNDAIKSGDSGRVVLVLKIWALSFRGNGRTKYTFEMLHLIHNLTSVWPEEIRYVGPLLHALEKELIYSWRKIVLNNWLLNPSGLPNRFVEMDLVQEHLNFRVEVHNFIFTWTLINHPLGFLQSTRLECIMGVARDHFTMCCHTWRPSESFQRQTGW